MEATYVHIKDTDNAVLKMYGVIKDGAIADPLKVVKCPRCHELNPESSAYCGKCGLPLKEEMQAKIEKDTAEIDIVLTGYKSYQLLQKGLLLLKKQ